jgi:hypothetical protein
MSPGSDMGMTIEEATGPMKSTIFLHLFHLFLQITTAFLNSIKWKSIIPVILDANSINHSCCSSLCITLKISLSWEITIYV